MDVQTILKLTVPLLKEHLKELNLPTSGAKPVLRDRLLKYFKLIDEDEGETDDYVEANTFGETDAADGTHEGFDEARCPITNTAPSKFTLNDVRDNLCSFRGTGSPGIGDWVREFEETANSVGWNDLQKFVYGKQLLEGEARLFVRSQLNVTSWGKLKKCLQSEFRVILSAQSIHASLAKRKKKVGESCREYLYALLEIGKPIQLDEKSLISYFANGILDSRLNKTVLYQAKTIVQLKEAIEVYETVHPADQSAKDIVGFKPRKLIDRGYKAEPSNCITCGSSSHVAKDCTSKTFKCFKCNQFGHRSFECTQNKKVEPKSKLNSMGNDSASLSNLIYKNIELNDITFPALLDTGCDLSIIRYDTLMKVGDTDLSTERITVHGVKDSFFNTIGSFRADIKVDGISLQTKMHVVRERDLEYAAVIGNDILKHVDILCKEDGAIFLPKCGSKSSNLSENFHSYRNHADRTKQFVQNCEYREVDGRKAKSTVIDDNDNDKRTESKVEKSVVSRLEDGSDVFHEFNVICSSDQEEFTKTLELEVGHLTQDNAETIVKMIGAYQPSRTEPAPTEMKIIVADDIPVRQAARRISHVDKEFVEMQVEKWIHEGIVQPSSSEYASPIVLVAKKDNTKRLCCDYRKLNEKILRDNFPMTVMDDVIERLTKATIFITLDLKNGFFHVPVAVESRKFTAFITHHGLFEFLFVPFGITNSPAVFSRYVHAVFRDLITDGTLVIYVDDIVIPARNENECIEKFKRVLDRGSRYGLNFKWPKCQFLKSRIEFLGYIIEDSTIQPSEAKTAAVKNFPIPVNKLALQRFLGLTSYFRRFIKSYANIARPLSDLLKKDANFLMEEMQILAFNQLKYALIKAPVLKLYCATAVTEVHTDASMYGYGGVLLQKEADDQEFHPVQYMSRKTSNAEEKYHSYELEVLAIIEALKKWRIYLMGLHFTIVTDCNAFSMTMKKTDIPLRVARWALFLQDFDFKIIHRPGSGMKHVDALSRMSCLILESSLKSRLKEAQGCDEWIKAVRTVLGKEQYEDFFVTNGLLYKDRVKELLVIPTLMEEEVIRTAHRQGHLSAKKTREYIEKNFFIQNINNKVTKIVANCLECIMTDSKRAKKEGFLNPIEKDETPLSTYHIDHVGPLEATSKSYNHILVVVDAFSKFVWLYPTRSTDAKTVVERLEKQSAIFGNPKRIITDRGTAFTANVFKEYCENQGIQHLLIATGVPRGNGQVERMHKILVPMLAKLCLGNSSTWYRHVDKVQRAINSTPPRSTCVSPFRVLTGLEMRINDGLDVRNMIEEYNVQELDDERNLLRTKAKENIAKIQQENRKNFDRNRIPAPNRRPGDLVAIKRTQFGTGMKLRPKFLGPYRVDELLPHDRLKVSKVGNNEGPKQTITVAEYVKPWCSSSETYDSSG